MGTLNARDVLDFWFGDMPLGAQDLPGRARLWFASQVEDDERIRDRFGKAVAHALVGGYQSWASEPPSRLALILLLDQFTRAIYRSTPQAFAGDTRAFALASECVEQEMHRELDATGRVFLYMPFQHAEDRCVQQRSVELYRALCLDCKPELKPFAENSYEYAVEHAEIVERFGRFPHRNGVLARQSTEEEAQYLSDGAPSFGQ